MYFTLALELNKDFVVPLAVNTTLALIPQASVLISPLTLFV